MGKAGEVWGRRKSGMDMWVAAKKGQGRRSNHYRYEANKFSSGVEIWDNVEGEQNLTLRLMSAVPR